MKPRPEQRSLAPAAAPQRHAIHIADLLRMTASLPRRQWADAADVLGYNWYPKDEPAPPPQRQPSKQSDPTEADDLPAAPAPAQADERTEQLFWRVFADRLDPQSSTGEPDWLLQARTAPGPAGCFESSGLLRLPQAAPLVSAGRLARFLRQRLAQPRQGSEIDLDWLVKRLARREPVVALRRQWHPRWPLRLNMVLQTDASLGPLREDLRAVAHQVRRLLGERVRWLECPGGPQRLWDARHRPITLRADGNAVLLLGDAGRYQPSQRVQRDWLAWGERLARTGSRPLLLAPLPLRLLDADTAGAFDVALLDESPRLRLQSSLRPRLAAPSQRGADSASDETTPQQATLDALTGLLAGLSGVEPAMLRLLRRGLKSAGLTHADIGAEVEFIGLPQVEWDGAWCRVKPGHEGRTIAALRALPLAPEAMSHLLTEVDAWSQTLSPLLQAERAQVWRQHWPEAGEAGSTAEALPPSANALQIWAWMAEVLSRPADPAQPGLAAYMVRLGRHNPGLVGTGPRELQAAWGLAQRGFLDRAKPPAGLDLSQLQWLMPNGPTQALLLQGQGSTAKVMLVPDEARQATAALCRQLRGVPHVSLQPLTEDGQIIGTAQHHRPGELMVLDATQHSRWRLSVGARRIDLDAIAPPAWAESMEREGQTLFATLAEANLSRRLRWVPRRAFEVVAPAQGQPRYEMLHGAWWDDAEYTAFIGAEGQMRCPGWANAGHGTDEFGYWAAFSVGGVTQTTRFVPPGRFTMGSPDGTGDEPEEAGRDDDEHQHPVLLTRGYWLADTACTQALWQAVMGQNPSNFTDDDQGPVEQVSWDDIGKKFLPKLAGAGPGLTLRLPTEAEWEYAARCAGQAMGPFSWGEGITTDNANYNGNYPLREGDAKGEYRRRTMPVKSFKPNALGLWQMHGNVWEWTADPKAEYPSTEMVDQGGFSGPEGSKGFVYLVPDRKGVLSKAAAFENFDIRPNCN